jgi:hypothetical protein
MSRFLDWAAELAATPSITGRYLLRLTEGRRERLKYLTAFAQGGMGCVFSFVSPTGQIVKVAYQEVVDEEQKIMDVLSPAGSPAPLDAHVAITKSTREEIWLSTTSTGKPDGSITFVTKDQSGNVRQYFEIPKHLAKGRDGCGTLVTKLKRKKNEPIKVTISTANRFSGDLTALRPEQIDLEDIAAQMDNALAFLRKHSVIHRDIKGENIYFKIRDDGTVYCALGDFGIATFADKYGLTTDEDFAGTLAYLDIDCLRIYDSSRGTRACSTYETDKFALGATLIQMWARSLGDTSDGPLYGRKKKDKETKVAYTIQTIIDWTRFLAGKETVVPASYIEKCSFPPGVTPQMDKKTKALISRYFQSTTRYRDKLTITQPSASRPNRRKRK